MAKSSSKKLRGDKLTNMETIRGLLASGDKAFTQIQHMTGFSSRTVAKNLETLVDQGDVTPVLHGKRTVYSLSSKRSAYSLIGKLSELRDKGAWYVHIDAPRYWQYGLKTDFACLPETNQKLALETETTLEKAFMEALGKAASAENAQLDAKEGRLLVAFEVDLAALAKEMKKTGNRIVPYAPSDKDRDILRKVAFIKIHKKNWIVNAETGKIYDRATKKEIPWKEKS
jgi:DNA-binding HxlR family transcriptional regulator